MRDEVLEGSLVWKRAFVRLFPLYVIATDRDAWLIMFGASLKKLKAGGHSLPGLSMTRS